MKFFSRRWHDIGLISAMVAGTYLAFAWSDLEVLQRLLLLNFIVVLLHQFEEYSWPGGFPAVANRVMLTGPLLRYFKPLNQLSSMAANVLFAYVVYLVPVFFPDTIWLGLSPVLIGAVLQVIGHAIYVNIKIRSLWSPGAATAVFGFLPVGVVYINHIQTNNLATASDWSLAVLCLFVSGYLVFYLVEQKLLGDAPYPFDQDEMERCDIAGKLERANRRRAEKKLALDSR
ncbi:MAG: HXXEE domain-containing protein [Acidimicrobiia bacterium]